MRALLNRIRDFFRRPALARQFAEEMSAHMAALEADLIKRGVSPAEAKQAATREFGNVLQIQEDLRTQAGFRFWDEFSGDVKNAWRSIRRRPSLAISVVGILALGLGAAATIHGLLDAVYLQPLPVPRPTELYAVVNADVARQSRLSRNSAARLEELLPAHSVAAYSGLNRCAVQFGTEPAVRVNVRLVNGNFFSALGLPPTVGRGFTPEDDVPGRPAHVAVLSAAWAVKNFGSVEAVIGREVTVNRVPLTVIGVLPVAFRDVTIGRSTDLWLPTALQPTLRFYGNASTTGGDDRPNDPDWNREERISWMEILLRIRTDIPSARLALERAWNVQRDDLAPAFDDPASREQLMHQRWDLLPAPGGRSGFRDSFRSTGLLFTGVVGVMLVLVCMNVSGLLLVRSMSRHREIGVRLAIGAGSFRVVRLSFMEALILCIAGASAGWLLAAWLLPSAVQLLAPGQSLGVSLGGRSLLLMAGLALFTTVLSALTPAWWISRIQPLQALSGSQGLGRAPVRLSRFLVIAQFALAVALVAVAASLGEELQRSLAADPGFNRDQVITTTFDPESAGYDPQTAEGLLTRMETIALSVPGVKAVSFASSGILAGSRSTSGLFMRHPQAQQAKGEFQHDSVQPGYMGVVGMPILAGRDFREGDRAGQPVALVSASFARQIFGNIDPLGQSFGNDLQPSAKDFTIVGVVRDVPTNGMRERPPAMAYFPLVRGGNSFAHFMAVRFEGAAATVQPALRAALARGEPGLVLSPWRTFEERMADNLSGDFATTHLAAIFGGCAVLLAGAGVAASLGYMVVLRQRELALRMAIGASPGQVLRSVLLDALRASAWGGALGLAVAWLIPLLPAVSAALHGRPGLLPAIVAAAVAFVAAMVAAWFPARRAARINPVLMLKSD
jgi:predicted permease